MRNTRIIAAALLAATIAFTTGCAHTPPPVSQQVQDYYDQAQARASQRATPTPTATAAPLPAGFDLASIKAVIANNPTVVVSVLGDSTGNGPGEWVDLWGKHLAAVASVTIHTWDQDVHDWRAKVTSYPGPAGRSIEIWNGSMPGATADYPATRMTIMQPTKPDVTILSFGHNGMPGVVGPDLLLTTNAVTTLWGGQVPTVAILQNAAGAPRVKQTDANQAALKLWASNSGTPLIDVRSSFDAAPDLAALLNPDGTGVHPNAAGQQLWVDAVIAALG